MSKVTAAFADALQSCSRSACSHLIHLQYLDEYLSLKGPSYDSGTRLQAASGLHHLIGNHWHVLVRHAEFLHARKVLKGPCRRKLSINSSRNPCASILKRTERSFMYGSSFRLLLTLNHRGLNPLGSFSVLRECASRKESIHKGYGDAQPEQKGKEYVTCTFSNSSRFNLTSNSDLQSFREALNILQRQVDELDDLKASHYREIVDHEEKVWEVVQAKVRSFWVGIPLHMFLTRVYQGLHSGSLHDGRFRSGYGQSVSSQSLLCEPAIESSPLFCV